MATFSVRVPDELATRFDATAGLFGGRSALLRRLIAGAASGPTVSPVREPRTALRLMVRLSTEDATGVEAEARACGLRRSAWVAALVRRRVRGKPTFPRPDELALIAMQTELRRIGVNVNQIARAMNTAVMEGRVLAAELSYIDALRRELRAHIGGLREAFEGNLAYWDVEL
jgi:hypothetical protein